MKKQLWLTKEELELIRDVLLYLNRMLDHADNRAKASASYEMAGDYTKRRATDLIKKIDVLLGIKK